MRRLSTRSTLVVLFSVLYAISVTACGRGSGSASSPIASDFDAPRSAQSIVAAAGNGEAQVQRYIADAGQAGKVARFVTVSTKNAKHIFPPSANILRSGKALIVLSYSRMYVWPLSAVTITYSAKPDAAVELTLLPAVSTPKLDQRIAQFETGAWPIHKKVPAGEQLCGDCVLLLGKLQRRGLSDGWQQLEDPWQQHADYTSWQDPAIIAQTTVSAGKSPSSVRVAQDECTTDGEETTCSGSGSGTNYYSGGGGGGGGGTPTPLPICDISAVAAATPMTARTTLGVGESVTVSSTMGSAWRVSGNGTLTTASGSQTTFNAGLASGSATVTVVGSACTDKSMSFTITAPTGILYVSTGITQHTMGWSDIGLVTKEYLLPDGVSFKNIGVLEYPALRVVTDPYYPPIAGGYGVYDCWDQTSTAPNSNPIQVGDDVSGFGSFVSYNEDDIGICPSISGFMPGRIYWNIQYGYTNGHANGDIVVAQVFFTGKAVATATGLTTMVNGNFLPSAISFQKGSATAPPMTTASATSTFPPGMLTPLVATPTPTPQPTPTPTPTPVPRATRSGILPP